MSAPSTDDRVVNVELLLTHLQHDFEQLSQVIWRQQAEIDSLRTEVVKLSTRVVTLAENPEVRDPQEEKPPHY